MGKKDLGFVVITTGASGDAAFNVLLPSTAVVSGQVVTATATDRAGNSSEFSLALLVN